MLEEHALLIEGRFQAAKVWLKIAALWGFVVALLGTLSVSYESIQIQKISSIAGSSAKEMSWSVGALPWDTLLSLSFWGALFSGGLYFVARRLEGYHSSGRVLLGGVAALGGVGMLALYGATLLNVSFGDSVLAQSQPLAPSILSLIVFLLGAGIIGKWALDTFQKKGDGNFGSLLGGLLLCTAVTPLLGTDGGILYLLNHVLFGAGLFVFLKNERSSESFLLGTLAVLADAVSDRHQFLFIGAAIYFIMLAVQAFGAESKTVYGDLVEAKEGSWEGELPTFQTVTFVYPLLFLGSTTWWLFSWATGIHG